MNRFSNITNQRGSILIWTTLLGLLLTSSFFFFATRLQSMSAVQRDTIEYQSEKAYVQSYVDYLTNPLLAPPLAVGNYYFDGINVKVEAVEVPEVTGILDFGEEKTFTFTEGIDIEWSLCNPVENGQVEVKIDSIIDSSATYDCTSPLEYGYKLNKTPTTDITIKALNKPVSYKITPNDGGLPDPNNKLQITATKTFGYGQKIEIEEVVSP